MENQEPGKTRAKQGEPGKTKDNCAGTSKNQGELVTRESQGELERAEESWRKLEG